MGNILIPSVSQVTGLHRCTDRCHSPKSLLKSETVLSFVTLYASLARKKETTAASCGELCSGIVQLPDFISGIDVPESWLRKSRGHGGGATMSQRALKAIRREIC